MEPTPEKIRLKGKTVGVWVSGNVQQALEDMRKGNEYFREGTYATEALIQRLQREGQIKDGDAGTGVAARAYELSRLLGPEPVKAKLEELAQELAMQTTEGAKQT